MHIWYNSGLFKNPLFSSQMHLPNVTLLISVSKINPGISGLHTLQKSSVSHTLQ